MMEVVPGMRWPQRSPEELREFYSIALRPVNTDTRGLVQAPESRSSDALTGSSSGSIRPHSSSSTSIFSGQAHTTSSATSVNDSKFNATLSSRTRYEDTTGLLRLDEWQFSCPQNLESHAKRTLLVTEGDDTSVSHQSYGVRGKPIEYGRRGRAFLPKFNRYQARSEANDQDSSLGQVTAISADAEEPSWLDTLQEHPYYGLEGEGKLGRVGRWAVKRRRRDLKAGFPNTHVQETDDADIDADLAKNELLDNSLSESDDETIHIIDDAVEEAPSLMGSSESRLRRRHSKIDGSDSPSRTLLLDLGLKSSLESDCLDNQSIVSTWASTLKLSEDTDSDDMAEGDVFDRELRTTSKPRNDEYPCYYCLFCFDQFLDCKEWENHEYGQHVAMQKEFICMPWGAVEKLDNGVPVCVFCGLEDPDSSHSQVHNHKPCGDTSVTSRTYSCKADFAMHLRQVHDQDALTDRMERWAFPPELKDWYWQCGFCERSLVGWEDRSRHIGRHFREGLTLACWDPFILPSPISRNTGLAVSWSPPVKMDRKNILAMQLQSWELNNSGSRNLVNTKFCKYCTAIFHSRKEVDRHEQLWHLPRHVWACPTKKDVRNAAHLQTGPLSAFLFPSSTPAVESSADACPYCNEYSEDIFYDLHEDITECSADWEIRIEHLESEHNFDQCSSDFVLSRPDQFLLHLVGHHNLKLGKWTKEIMDSCIRRKLPSSNVSINDDESNGVV